MSISNADIKKLYGLSAGRCNLCQKGLFENDVHIGEMAHIIAKSGKGPRNNGSLSSDINSYENLILLCANHHTEVDQNEIKFTMEGLKAIKSEHESNIASIFNSPRDRANDISFLSAFMKYVPFTRLRSYVEHLPKAVYLDLCTVGDMFNALCLDNPHLHPLNDSNLDAHFDAFLEAYYALWGHISGYTNVDGRMLANYSQADERFYLHMERKYLPYQSVAKLNQEVETANYNFIQSYLKLIDFLRKYYKEVDLNAYVPT